MAKAVKKTSAASDAVICVCAALVCSFWGYEKYVSGSVMRVFCLIAGVIMVWAWIWYSLSNGIRRKKGFAVFTAVYWILPLSIASYADSITDPKKYNAVVRMLGDFSKLLGEDAVKVLPVIKGLSPALGTSILLGISLFAFFTGMHMVKGRNFDTPPEDADDDSDEDDSENENENDE